ncbi:DUF2267 domain-containing protein [Pyxidicoccus parkwayensis]|uniref:DUF2267 domain-containing protein n=1 Tax=Pyxidicoccus parkwayensis TaxID=2813578 RepID=A0ABX7P6M7_9BACT|nr:DUF2267 domain-containing protein [Pyxidicoccus parkwaysis]QSQ26123.1 DUF2267 domain-containing protein [Pyxidicoccus parkwaysis]
MTHDDFLMRVAERAGLSGPEEAARVASAVLGVVGERLGRKEVLRLAEDLPAPLVRMLETDGPEQDFDEDALYTRIAGREHVRPGFAMEHTGVVCGVLAEALSDGSLHRLHEYLPGPLGALLTPREPRERFEYIHVEPTHRTLAEGTPGSEHPLSSTRLERAHTHSVARAANPHGDTKLSSSTGLTQEREEETLASAPGLTQEREHTTLAEAHPGMRLARGEEE